MGVPFQSLPVSFPRVNKIVSKLAFVMNVPFYFVIESLRDGRNDRRVRHERASGRCAHVTQGPASAGVN